MTEQLAPWEAELLASAYEEGDRVTATKGEETLTARVRRSPNGNLCLGSLGQPIPVLLGGGWVLNKREAVPTKSGIYRDKDGDLWVVLDGKPVFVCHGEEADLAGVSNPEDYLPFRRVEVDS